MKTYYWYWSFSGLLGVRSKKPNCACSTIRAGSIFEAELVARDMSMLARRVKGFKHKYGD